MKCLGKFCLCDITNLLCLEGFLGGMGRCLTMAKFFGGMIQIDPHTIISIMSSEKLSLCL